MFYDTRTGRHGLPHNPFAACVVPRCIGWITSLDGEGRPNLAPYSYFNALCNDPPMVMFSNVGAGDAYKDTLANVAQTGEFVCNMATWELREQMNASSAPVPRGMSEIAIAGLETEPAALVKPPRVKASPVHLECRLWRVVELPGRNGARNAMAIGEVIGLHIRDEVLTDGRVDPRKFRPIARLGYQDYAAVDDFFTMVRPTAKTAPGAKPTPGSSAG